MEKRPDSPKSQSPWDEWQEILQRIQAIEEELKTLHAREEELSHEMMDALNRRNYGVRMTRRESEIMDLLRKRPMPMNKEIAADLNIAERTVKFHISALLRKFSVGSRQDLVIRFLKPLEREKT